MAARANDRETEWCVSGRTVNSYTHKLPRAHAADIESRKAVERLDGRRSWVDAPTAFRTQPLLVEL